MLANNEATAFVVALGTNQNSSKVFYNQKSPKGKSFQIDIDGKLLSAFLFVIN